MLKTCYLHIGTEKTGSTSIQAFLAHNRESIERDGFYYPQSLGLPNQVGLAPYVGQQDQIKMLWLRMGLANLGEVAAFKEKLARDLKAELTSLDRRESRVLLLSNEHLHGRVRDRQSIARLKQFLSPFCDDIKILVYIRRQDLIAVSLASTYYKSGHSQPWTLPDISDSLPYYYDYATFIDNYASAFGADNIIVRIFESDRLKNGDVLEDYMDVVGLKPSPDLKYPANQNPSLTALGQRLLAELNRHIPLLINNKRNAMRDNLVDVISKQYPGKSNILSRDEAKRFYSGFAASNASVRTKYLPQLDRPSLFSESFDDYPLRPSTPDFSFEQGCQAAAELWTAQTRALQRRRKKDREYHLALQSVEQELSAAAGRVSDPGVAEALTAALARLSGVKNGLIGAKREE